MKMLDCDVLVQNQVSWVGELGVRDGVEEYVCGL